MAPVNSSPLEALPFSLSKTARALAEARKELDNLKAALATMSPSVDGLADSFDELQLQEQTVKTNRNARAAQCHKRRHRSSVKRHHPFNTPKRKRSSGHYPSQPDSGRSSWSNNDRGFEDMAMQGCYGLSTEQTWPMDADSKAFMVRDQTEARLERRSEGLNGVDGSSGFEEVVVPFSQLISPETLDWRAPPPDIGEISVAPRGSSGQQVSVSKAAGPFAPQSLLVSNGEMGVDNGATYLSPFALRPSKNIGSNGVVQGDEDLSPQMERMSLGQSY
ncbi:hypothetical protein GLOTRDRAFT_96376 [Gloeophyllum trabeum ATCC 11539]|uniref:Uncharacterized protein n=1 Tax=Gloeophyllum trabeum (strain ATCC 11539 / FP-39264 / Madison 617) TaxID=670483 RepID=S7RGI5_GLOTA|nr:uncharacterized protein GLOTRDRAFT_96376 [Gloeophyllum trabeum ATCC 11539]EPQ51664.1 hypothetical protein GLOTRDRAFT_96376 [Gloeophyllum trabeum ATCC 11539]